MRARPRRGTGSRKGRAAAVNPRGRGRDRFGHKAVVPSVAAPLIARGAKESRATCSCALSVLPAAAGRATSAGCARGVRRCSGFDGRSSTLPSGTHPGTLSIRVARLTSLSAPCDLSCGPPSLRTRSQWSIGTAAPVVSARALCSARSVPLICAVLVVADHPPSAFGIRSGGQRTRDRPGRAVGRKIGRD